MANQHVTPDSLGKVLYALVAGTEEDVANRYSAELEQLGVPQRVFTAELLALRWIALDFAVTLVFGQSPNRAAILDPYLDCLHENTDPSLERFLEQRICQHAIVLNNADSNPSLRMGDALARFLFERESRPEDDSVVIAAIGAIEFAIFVKGVQDLLSGVVIDW